MSDAPPCGLVASIRPPGDLIAALGAAGRSWTCLPVRQVPHGPFALPVPLWCAGQAICHTALIHRCSRCHNFQLIPLRIGCISWQIGRTPLSSGLKYGSAPARRAQILDLLGANGAYLSQAGLSHLLGVSEMTIRRDAHDLEKQGLLLLVAGGVCLIREPLAGNDFRLRAQARTALKRQLAAAALSMVAPNSTIAIDAGTTLVEMARLIGPAQMLKVVTASLPVMTLLVDRPNVQLYGLGGELHPRTQAFAGLATIEALRHLRVEQLFLGASAVSRGGTYEGNTWDAEIKRAMIAAADQVVLVVDSSKFERSAIALAAPLTAVHVAVVDDGISTGARDMLETAGIRVVTVVIGSEAAMSGSATRKEQAT